MTKKRGLLLGCFLIFTSFWFGMSALLDFVAVPNIFMYVSSLKEAGSLGILIFSIFNKVELLFAVILVVLTFALMGKSKKKWIPPIFSIGLLTMALYYNFSLSPKIEYLTLAKNEHEMGTEIYDQFQEQHDFYHHLYVKLDAVKLIGLLFLLGHGLIVIGKEKEI